MNIQNLNGFTKEEIMWAIDNLQKKFFYKDIIWEIALFAEEKRRNAISEKINELKEQMENATIKSDNFLKKMEEKYGQDALFSTTQVLTDEEFAEAKLLGNKRQEAVEKWVKFMTENNLR